MITVEIDHKLAKQLAGAMTFIADVARVQRVYGNATICPTCGLRYVAPTKYRCSCKVKR